MFRPLDRYTQAEEKVKAAHAQWTESGDEETRITLAMRGCELTDRIPPLGAVAGQLKSLDLGRNALSSLSSLEIEDGHLDLALTALYINKNSLGALEARLPLALVRIDASTNRIAAVAEFSPPLTALQNLDLSSNQLYGPMLDGRVGGGNKGERG